MPVTVPVHGEDLVVSVAATAIGTKTPVNGMNRYSGRKSRAVNRTPVFMRAAQYISRGRPDWTFSLSGLFIPDDPGQQLIRDAEAAGTSVFLTVLPDGLNGKMQECIVGQLSEDADPDNLETYGFEFTGVDVPTVIVAP
jgi:hypothetical protein